MFSLVVSRFSRSSPFDILRTPSRVADRDVRYNDAPANNAGSTQTLRHIRSRFLRWFIRPGVAVLVERTAAVVH